MENPYLKEYRDKTLRPAQLRMLAILQEVVDICDRHEIPYWLDGGTLLGAKRHGGFIPWDDDIDISMRKEDLKRFLEVAPDELSPHLKLQSSETEKEWTRREYKVRDLNSFMLDVDDDNHCIYEKGLCVDIFPFILYPAHLQKVARKVARSLAVMDARLKAPHRYSLRAVAELFYFGGKRMVYRWIWSAMRPLCKSGKYTCSIPYFNWYGVIYRTADIFPLGEIEFEGMRFKCPGKVEDYLSCIFPNWKQLPPPEKRVAHSVIIIPQLSKEK